MKKNIIPLLLFIMICIVLGTVNAVILDNDIEVEPDTELTYYIDVNCDGVDRYGVHSNDDITAEVKSDYIYVSDTIPDGLEFIGFVTSNDGSFGAVKRDD